MEENNQKAKELMEKGWKSREDLEFEEAEELLTEAKDLFEADGDWFNVTEALNHLALAEKLKAVHSNLKGMSIAEESLEIANQHGTKKHLTLRTLMSLASSSGEFERALHYGLEALPLYDEPAAKADILSHISTFYLRTGRMEEAEEAIKEAKWAFEEGYDGVGEPHKTIWETRIILAEAIILYNRGEPGEAKELGEQALNMAKKAGRKTRTAEIEVFLELFNLH